jgi:type 1 glutamine amidotransferase
MIKSLVALLLCFAAAGAQELTPKAPKPRVLLLYSLNVENDHVLNEWYRWKPSPRADSHIHVLLTLDPANYPLGIKGLLTSGDVPVVWTNTQYKMVYTNMGHGDKIFTSPVQNKLIQNAAEWLLGK